MSDAAATLGIAPEFEFEGVKYPCAMRTFEHEAMFSAFLSQNELDGIALAEQTMPHLVPAMMKNWGHNMATRAYAWRSPLAYEAIGRMDGWKQMAWFRLREKTPTVKRDLIDRIVDNPRKFQELQMILNWLDDPNRQGQAPPKPTE